ncbi:MAG TPA: hypothetical protein VEU28_08725 [Actinomycetota bacterium]|nr:hypothetical protein [Actinomycetota bacterium]
MSFVVDQSLVDTMLSVEEGLDDLEERKRARDSGEFSSTVDSIHSTYLRLTNQMRELTAALDYCLKVNKQVAVLQRKCETRLLEMFGALETPETEKPDDLPD